MPDRLKVAIVGAGVSGLLAAHLLHERHDLRVFEVDARAGGHTNTVRVDSARATHSIETGFIVFNDRNYPRFERLLASQPTDMSFGVSDEAGDFEYASTSPNGRFARRAHLVSPRFHHMLADVRRFQAEARALLQSPRTRRWATARAPPLPGGVRRPPDRAPGRCGVVRRPAPDVVVPGARGGAPCGAARTAT